MDNSAPMNDLCGHPYNNDSKTISKLLATKGILVTEENLAYFVMRDILPDELKNKSLRKNHSIRDLAH